MDLIVYGTSHKMAPVEIRERMSLSGEEVLELLSQFQNTEGLSECVILSTCNRTEIYAACEDNFDARVIAEKLLKFKTSDISLGEHFYLMRKLDVAGHLLKVASGLESQVIGENQIQGQVKDAYHVACGFGSTGPYLNKLFHLAFRIGKKVRTDTNLGAGAVSISSAAVELANYVYETISGKKALLIGAGETGEQVAKHLIDRGIASLTIANRTRANAERLAEVYAADVIDYEKIAENFFLKDIVISATAGTEYVLTREMVSPHREGNLSRRVVAIDIAIPRDIDPAIADYENVFVYDMDDLKTVVDKNLEERRRGIPRAEKIIESATGEYEKWMRGQRVVPTIKYLQGAFESVRVSELQKNKHCGTCEKRSQIDALTKSILNKILSAPITRLVQDTKCSEAELTYLRNIFSGKTSDEE